MYTANDHLMAIEIRQRIGFGGVEDQCMQRPRVRTSSSAPSSESSSVISDLVSEPAMMTPPSVTTACWRDESGVFVSKPVLRATSKTSSRINSGRSLEITARVSGDFNDDIEMISDRIKAENQRLRDQRAAANTCIDRSNPRWGTFFHVQYYLIK